MYGSLATSSRGADTATIKGSMKGLLNCGAQGGVGEVRGASGDAGGAAHGHTRQAMLAPGTERDCHDPGNEDHARMCGHPLPKPEKSEVQRIACRSGRKRNVNAFSAVCGGSGVLPVSILVTKSYLLGTGSPLGSALHRLCPSLNSSSMRAARARLPWDARLARRLVGPLGNSWVTPNHLTTRALAGGSRGRGGLRAGHLWVVERGRAAAGGVEFSRSLRR